MKMGSMGFGRPEQEGMGRTFICPRGNIIPVSSPGTELDNHYSVAIVVKDNEIKMGQNGNFSHLYLGDLG